jgi:hypothetical protein
MARLTSLAFSSINSFRINEVTTKRFGRGKSFPTVGGFQKPLGNDPFQTLAMRALAPACSAG